MAREGRRVCVVLAVLMVAAGCGSNKHPELRRVTGRVLFLDEPVADAVVAFYSVDSLRAATGRTDEQGEFYLTTFNDNDGALPGEHSVTVTKTTAHVDDTQLSMDEAVTEVRRPAKTRLLLPARYSSVDTTPLRFTVTDKGPNELTIELHNE